MSAEGGEAVSQRRSESLQQIAEVIRNAEITAGPDESKLTRLKAQREQEKRQAKATAKELKLETRKKSRLMKKVAGLPTNDLLACARIRFDNQDARETAKRVRAERGTSSAGAPAEGTTG